MKKTPKLARQTLNRTQIFVLSCQNVIGSNCSTLRFETPFTKGGSARGSIAEQFMRKTYLGVDHAFPFVKTRQEVTSTHEKELCPLEVAIETIDGRAASLETITYSKTVNIKLLQLRLQVFLLF